MFRKARESYNSNGFFCNTKEVAEKFDKYYPKLLNNMLKMDKHEHNIGPARFYC